VTDLLGTNGICHSLPNFVGKARTILDAASVLVVGLVTDFLGELVYEEAVISIELDAKFGKGT
jgi:hypothetical protein